LHGKEGITEQLRESICARAQELGYTNNYVASSLKRKALRLAVVLPRKDGSGRFYFKYAWDAIYEFYPEANSLNTEIECHYFDYETDQQMQMLQSLVDAKEPVDGLLTMVAKSDEAMANMIKRFGYRNIPVVLLDNDLPGVHRIACVAPHDKQIGRLGAEILCAITHNPGKILVAGGSPESASHRCNLEGFSEYIAENSKQLELVVAHEHGNYERCYAKAANLLDTHKDIVAFYSVTARDTLPLCKAVQDSGLAKTLRGVGSDLYPESAELLRNDTVQALIYKNAFDKGRIGLRILFDYVVKNIRDVDQIAVPISVIMKNNLLFFEKYI